MKTATGVVVVGLIVLAASAGVGKNDTTPPSAPPAVVEEAPVDVPKQVDADDPRPGKAYTLYVCDENNTLTRVEPDTPEARADAQANCDRMSSEIDKLDWPDHVQPGRHATG